MLARWHMIMSNASVGCYHCRVAVAVGTLSWQYAAMTCHSYNTQIEMHANIFFANLFYFLLVFVLL